jgi:hypothetical protein
MEQIAGSKTGSNAVERSGTEWISTAVGGLSISAFVNSMERSAYIL